MQSGEDQVGVFCLPTYVEAELLLLRFPQTHQAQMTSVKFILTIISLYLNCLLKHGSSMLEQSMHLP